MIAISVSVIVTVVIVLLYSALVQAKINAKGGCPECGTPVPKVRRTTPSAKPSGTAGPAKPAPPKWTATATNWPG